MPFGTKSDGGDRQVDFNAVYESLIKPAIEDAGMHPIRADHEVVGGIIHKPMFERLMLCDYAVADLTGANANVFYELGIRHVVRPHTTIAVFAGDARLAFDVNFLRSLPYSLDARGALSKVDTDRAKLAEQLRHARAESAEPPTDSPVYQLVPWWQRPDLAHQKTDVFRDRVRYSEDCKTELAAVRGGARRAASVKDPAEKKRLLDEAGAALDAIRDRLRPLAEAESALTIDLLLSYRALGTAHGWTRMIELAGDLAGPLRATAMVQEQLAFALNRNGESDRAEQVLKRVLECHGASSETYGLLGRVIKDRWEQASKSEDAILAEGLLTQAIEAYLSGFEADWRDAYPGINAVTLMEIADDPRRHRVLPVVRYAVERKVAKGQPDYWDFATQVELAVLARDKGDARKALSRALSLRAEPWQRETTARNLRLIRDARAARGETLEWAEPIERELVPAEVSAAQ